MNHSRPAPLRTSEVLQQVLVDETKTEISLGELMEQLGERAFGFMLFILAFPNCLPMPPGFSTITGVPMLWLAFQKLRGKHHPQFPKTLADRKFPRAPLAKAVKTILPALNWLEKLSRPRWLWLADGKAELVITSIMLAMALVLMLPIPLGNFPQAFAIAIMAFGLIETDGVLIMLGAIWGIGASLVLYQGYVLFFVTVWNVIMDHIWPWLSNLLA